jgi:hypothetical protein
MPYSLGSDKINTTCHAHHLIPGTFNNTESISSNGLKRKGKKDNLRKGTAKRVKK